MTAAEQPQTLEVTRPFVPPHDSSSDILDSQHEVQTALQDFRNANIAAASRLLVQELTESTTTTSILPHTHHADVAAHRLKTARDTARKRMVDERLSVILQRQAQ